MKSDDESAKERLTVHVSKGVADRARDCAYFIPGLTLAALAEDALRVAVEKLERKHGPFAKRAEKKLKGGRPLKRKS
jgi:hypothetical protein